MTAYDTDSGATQMAKRYWDATDDPPDRGLRGRLERTAEPSPLPRAKPLASRTRRPDLARAASLTLQRDPSEIATLRVLPIPTLNTTAIGRRIVKVPKVGPKPGLITGAVKSAISKSGVNLVKRPTPPRIVPEAKAIAADRRTNVFSVFPKNIDGTYSQIVPTKKGQFKFALPSRALPCVMRTTRREVLFAKRKAGRHGGQKRRRYSPHSNIGC